MYQNLLFEQPVDIRLAAFYSTPLGHLYQSIPFDNLAKQIQAPKKHDLNDRRNKEPQQ